MNLNSIGGRKFIATMTGLLMNGALVFNGSISDGVYSAVMFALIGAFITGNVYQKTAVGEVK